MIGVLEILAPIGAGSALALGIKWAYEAWKDRRSMPHTVRSMKRIYSELHATVAVSQADSLVIMTCANGGGIPHPGASLYTSILYEVTTGVLPSMFRYWQRVPVRGLYLDAVLLPLLGHGHVSFEPTSLERSELRTMYEQQAIKHVEVVSCTSDKMGWTYLVAHYLSETAPTDAQKLVLNTASRCLRDLLEGRDY